MRKLETVLLKPAETELSREVRRLSEQLQDKQVLDSLLESIPEVTSRSESTPNSPKTAESEPEATTTENNTVSKPNTEKDASSVTSQEVVDEVKSEKEPEDKIASVYKFFGNFLLW